jgi:hypothetical protein
VIINENAGTEGLDNNNKKGIGARGKAIGNTLWR